MIADILDGLVHANVAAAAAILVVMMLRKPARRLFGARVAYALWIVVPMAAAASLLPEPAAATLLSPVVLVAAGTVERAVPILAADRTPVMLLALWLAGVLAATGLLAYRQTRFMTALGRLEPLPHEPGVFRAEHANIGPAVVGAVRPRIVTPADFEDRFAADERAVILAHEDVHLRAGDARINALAAVAQCLAWFNPLIHLGARALRIDQELACDAAVLARFPTARRLYGDVLLKTQLATQSLPLGCHWPAAADHPLKERIVMLKSPLPAPSRRAVGLTLVAALSLGGAGIAWAAQADESVRERYQALKRAGVESDVVCKPDATGELKDCKIMQPLWTQKPTAEDLKRYYPPEALAIALGATVIMDCDVVSTTGRLQGCIVVHEELHGGAQSSSAAAIPNDAFAAAAINLSKVFQARTERAPGEPPLPPWVRIPIRFMPGPTTDAPPLTRLPPAIPPRIPQKGVYRTADPQPTPAAAMPKGTPYAVVCKPGAAGQSQDCLLVKPAWIQKPAIADMVRYYPPKALELGVGALVVIQCDVERTGYLKACSVVSENVEGDVPSEVAASIPKGSFAIAALELSKIFQARVERDPMEPPMPTTAVRIPIRFLPSPRVPGGPA